MAVIIFGFLAGIISGMGIGGGMILIPLLTFFANMSQHNAQAVNLYYFIPTAIFAIFVHIKNKNIDKIAAVNIIISGVIGSAVGAYIVSYIDDTLLKKMFSIFIALFGAYEIYTGYMTKKAKTFDK